MFAKVLYWTKIAARVCVWEHIAVVSPLEIRFLRADAKNVTFAR